VKTKSAVSYVLKHRKDAEGNAMTKYRLAMELGAAPVSVDQWLRRTKMGEQYRNVFYKKFGVLIHD
jgi:hypothetical protein